MDLSEEIYLNKFTSTISDRQQMQYSKDIVFH